MSNRSLAALMVAVVIALGCAPHHIFGDVMRQAEREIGEQIAERVVNAYLGEIGPGIIESYSIGLMQTMFYQGGYYADELEYEPTEYTIWRSDDSPYGESIERAFLKERDDGWQWWRLEIFGEDPDTDDDMHLIMEALFEPQEDRRYIREMYVQYPDDDEPSEVDIDEEDAERWAVRAEEWSEEELERAFLDTVEVEVPAGTFTADRYEADDPEQEDLRTEWWQTDREVPGSVVKIRQHEDADIVQTMRLDAYGEGADESVLGAF